MSSSSSADSSDTSDSGSGSEDGLQRANASAAGARTASQAQQRGRLLQRQTNAVPSRGSDSTELQHRLASIQLQYLPRSQEPSTAPSSKGTPKSQTSSMAISVSSRSTLASSLPSSTQSSYTAPSLCRSGYTLKSGSSISDGGFAIRQQYMIEEDDHGVPTLSEEETAVRLECCFGFLRCPHVFHELETWDRHCRAHYRRNLPRVARCPFPGCAWEEQTHQGQDVWQERLEHMEEEHAEDNYEYPRQRPTVLMLDGMLRAGMIDRLQYQELRRDGQLSTQPALNTTNRREDRRRRR